MAKKTIQRTCPVCFGELVAIWQNNGWNGQEGPRMDEVTGLKCPVCGYREGKE